MYKVISGGGGFEPDSPWLRPLMYIYLNVLEKNFFGTI